MKLFRAKQCTRCLRAAVGLEEGNGVTVEGKLSTCGTSEPQTLQAFRFVAPRRAPRARTSCHSALHTHVTSGKKSGP